MGNIKYSNISKADGVKSVAPAGKCRITNIYVDPETGRTVIEYEDVPEE